MSVPDWLPGAERHNGEGAGRMLDTAAWKFLIHTTEGPTLDGALQALDAKRAWSHLVYDPVADHVVQCISFNEAARALKSGGTQGRTNAAKVIQCEVVGFAGMSPQWSAQVNHNLGRLIARVAECVPFSPTFDLPFFGQDAGFTVASASARQRLGWDAWYRYDGICGHQHVPANDHWDPGAINTAQILEGIHGTSPTPPPTPLPTEDDMTPAQEAKLDHAVSAAAGAEKAAVILEASVQKLQASVEKLAAALGHPLPKS